MTLDGTNTWVLRAPGATRRVVVDPGPLDEGHLAAVRRAEVRAPGSRAIAAHPRAPRPRARAPRGSPELTGAPGARARPGVPARRRGTRRRRRRRRRRLEVEVVATPGHTGRLAVVRAAAPTTAGCSPATRCWAAAPRWSPTPTGGSAPTWSRWSGSRDAGDRPVVAAARPRPGAAGRRRDGRVATSPTARSGSSRCGRRRRGGRRRRPREVVAQRLRRRRPQRCGRAAELSVRAQLDYLRGRLTVSGRGDAGARRRAGHRACLEAQPAAAAKSASALLTVSREAPTSWASSSWVRSWATSMPVVGRPAEPRRRGRAAPWRPGPGRR